MREYVVLPRELLDDAAELRGWLGKAHAYALALPPKKVKSLARPRPSRPGRARASRSPRRP